MITENYYDTETNKENIKELNSLIRRRNVQDIKNFIKEKTND